MAAKARKNKGHFISFEGGEGCGKTTQITHLLRWLGERGVDARVTRQPGGTEIGARLREIVLDPNHGGLSPRTELLLYEADRAQHVDEVLRPLLEKGTTLISDRFADSSTVYQGICRGLGMDWVIELNDFATGGLQPDLTIVLDVSEKTSATRIKKRAKLDRIERESAAFHKKVRLGFLKLAKKFPRRFVVIDGERDEDEIAEEIRALVGKRLWKTRKKG